MSRTGLYLKHLSAAFILLVASVGILFLSRGLIEDILLHPEYYFDSYLSIEEIHFTVVFVSLIVIAVLVSYIFYLLLTFHTRFELEISGATKSAELITEQFKRLYDSAPVPYVMLNKNAEIYEPNKSALRFFGVVPEEVQGKNLFSYISGEDKEQAEKFFQYYKTGIPINRAEVQMITKSGAIKSVQISIFEIKNPGRFGSTGLAMIFDITEQKMIDKAKTEFVSLASHQLKTPLATTKWYTEMLNSPELGGLSDKQKEYIGRLNVANKEMIDLVDVLLNVSRIEMGSLSPEIKETNVEELSESILAELSILINQKKINIRREYNGHLQSIKSDPKLLRIVIQNLVSNAVKYTPNEGTVSIVLKESFGSKQIIISDTGIGIPKEAQEHIFSKLFRAENARAGEASGNGLGLYLVKSMIGGLGGSIDFKSEEGKGSTFTITL